jgi:hypothetical protein
MKKLLTLLFVFVVCIFSFAQLSGNYFIPQGANPQGYATLVAAITDLNTNGCSGTVYFYIDGDLAEIGANVLITRSDLNSTNNLVIKPASGKTPIITFSGCTATAGATQYTGFTLSGAGYVTVDGSNTIGGTTKDLTFKMNDATNGRNIMQLYGNCDNITVKNINILFQSPMSTSTSTRGIYLNGQATGACDNFITDNCNIGDATNTPFYDLGITGSSGSSIYCTNVVVKNSNLYGRIRPVYFFVVGTTGTSCEISGNNIFTYGGNNGTTTYTIFMNQWAGTVNIFKNKLPTMTTNNTVTSGIFGISALAAQTGATCNIYNNFIGGDLSFIGTGVPTVISLMYLQDNGTYNVYHNSFNYPSVSNNTERSCLHISGASANVTLKNNILINNTDATNAYCIWKSNGTLTSDYNDLYVSGINANVGYVGGAAKQTLAAWQGAGFGYDPNSQSFNVIFNSPTDLHLSCSFPSCNPLLLCSPVGISTDIDGDPRLSPPLGPYMGADEVYPLPVELTAFVAHVIGSSITLNWRTETESNSSIFVIERLNDNLWIKIGEIIAAGNSNSPKEYSYADKNLASGKYQYRLKMIDADGSYQYSNIAEAEINLPTEFSLSQNYPNPFNPTTQINYSLPFDTDVRLDIYSVNGELVRSLVNETQSAGSYNIEFNASDLASGTYIYRLIAKDFVQTKKMQLIK